jgi:hypothetical protein
MLRRLALLLVLVPSLVHADPMKAWAAAKDNLPAEASIVLGINVSALSKSQLATQLFPTVLAFDTDLKKTFDAFKSQCNLDPVTSIHSIAIAMDGKQHRGAIYVALQGTDRTRLLACIQNVSKSLSKTPATVKNDGAITELGLDSSTIALGWIGNDVVVVPLEDKSRATVSAWFGKKGEFAKSDAGKQIGKVNTNATMWGLSGVTQRIDNDLTVTLGYGTIAYTTGMLNLELHAIAETPKQASDTAQKTTQQIASMPQTDKTLADAMKTVKITATGNEILVKASIAESSLLSLLMMAMRF